MKYHLLNWTPVGHAQAKAALLLLPTLETYLRSSIAALEPSIKDWATGMHTTHTIYSRVMRIVTS